VRTAERIDQVDGPAVVGRQYLVPCVRLNWRKGWWPVTGPEHDDAEYIGIARRHWHYDVRFLTAPQLRRVWPEGDPRPAAALARILFADAVEGEPVWRRLRCRRPMPDFPLEMLDYHGDVFHSPFAAKLEDAYAGARLKPGCRTCPHRGVPLTGLEARDGVVVCPGHGLAWNLTTGELARRVPAREVTRGHV
jgi:hypothetical protein